jgi:hypothetical protein
LEDEPPTRLEPEKISIARLPVTGSDVFGREEDIAFLDRAWANQQVNVVTIVARAGVGKSTLVNHWLRRMATDHYRSGSLFSAGPSTDRAAVGALHLQMNFLDSALTWFGDPDPRLGTAWEKGERLAKLAAHRRTLLVLDGLDVIWEIILRDFWGAILRPLVTPYRRSNANARAWSILIRTSSEPPTTQFIRQEYAQNNSPNHNQMSLCELFGTIFCAVFGIKTTFRGAFIVAFASFQPGQLGGERRGISWAGR